MKHFLYILLFLPLFVQGQTLGLNNGSVTITNTGGISTLEADTLNGTVELQPEQIYFHYAHSNQSFKDSAVVITGGTNVQITNASDSLR